MPDATDLPDITSQRLQEHGLPALYVNTIQQVIEPLATGLATWQRHAGRPLLVALNGAQGTGKSTLATFLPDVLRHRHQLRCVVLSLDDVYLTRASRDSLAQQVHPLLQTRGVPGTHDLVLAHKVLDSLLNASADQPVALPSFDKAIDDRVPQNQWLTTRACPDLVLVEGWCMGAQAERDTQKLHQPVNQLERDEDPDGRWRHYVNQCLRFEYTAFFQRFDRLIMLQAPSFRQVIEWRTLQEHKLAARYRDAPIEGTRIMDDHALARFMMHYERLTLRMLDTLPSRADAVIPVSADHALGTVSWREGNPQ